jgi:hypothetical protein
MSLFVQEVGVNVTEGYRFAESPVYETGFDTPGEVYRASLREHGRCTGKVYVDKDGKALPVGWVFLRRAQYDDCKETYLQETWVTLHTSPDTLTRTPHYAPLT